MKNTNEREVLVNILMDIQNDSVYNNIILKRTLNNNKDLDDNQKRFITQVVNGTLRNLIYIDYIINSFSSTRTEKMKPFILSLLRTSVYQIKFMDKVPDFAVCNSAVDLAKAKGFKNLSGFVNGVLRNIVRNIDNVKMPNKEENFVEYLSVTYSMPVWIINYWLEFLGRDEVESLCAESLKNPKINICINRNLVDKNVLKEKLLAEGLEVEDAGQEDSLIINKTTDISALSSFKQGLYHIMDESSMRAVRSLSPEKEMKVLDVCAAPGGKSFYASYIMRNTGQIISCDIFPHKIKLIEESVQRLKIENITPTLQDATVLQEGYINKFDRVLVDAPCSGLGILQKKPDIKYNKTLQDIHSLVKLQRDILKVANQYVAEGGILVYSTCTISKLENDNNVKWFLEKYDYELVNMEVLLPNQNTGGDGFFIATFKRKGQ